MKSIKIDSVVDDLIRVKGSKIILTIDKEAKVIIKAPYYTQISEINNFIDSKRDWINKKREYILSNMPQVRTYIDGEKFLYLGKEAELKIVNDCKYAINFEDGKFLLNEKEKTDAKYYLESIYKNLAWNYFAPLTFSLAKKFNFKIKEVKISSAKGRWGSCSSRGTINLAWRLVMAPEDVIYYVIIHELAHTEQHNHSKNFWDIVEKIIPDYEKHIKWLKENGKYCDI